MGVKHWQARYPKKNIDSNEEIIEKQWSFLILLSFQTLQIFKAKVRQYTPKYVQFRNE